MKKIYMLLFIILFLPFLITADGKKFVRVKSVSYLIGGLNEIHYSVEEEYDAFGRVIIENSFSQKTGYSFICYKYDEEGNKDEIKSYSDEEYIERFEYDRKGRLKKNFTEYKNNMPWSYSGVTEYEYDENGKKIKMTYVNKYDAGYEDEGSSVYKYDAKGRLIKNTRLYI